MATVLLNSTVTLQPGAFDAVLVPTDPLQSHGIITTVQTSDPDVDVVVHSVNGTPQETVGNGDKLYVACRNNGLNPSTFVVEVAVEDNLAPPPQ